MVKISPVNGHIVVYSQDTFCLYLFNVDGRIIEKVILHERLNGITITNDGAFVISGGSKNTIVFRTLWEYASNSCSI